MEVSGAKENYASRMSNGRRDRRDEQGPKSAARDLPVVPKRTAA
jgi:hypothetical protein